MKKLNNIFFAFIFLFFYSFSINALMLDDMEDGNNQNNWGGYWYTYDDLGSGGNSYVVPWSDARWAASGQQSQPFFMQSPGRTGSGYAARMTGYVTTTFQYGYVGMGTSFLNPKAPVDLSTCTGITFWYKGDGRTYRLKISSSHPNFVQGEGDNHYGYAFASGTDWTQMDILMSSLTQEPYWGSSVNLSDALSMATDIQFQTVGQPHSSIDLWIDEIDIYGCSSYPITETPTFTETQTPGASCLLDDMEDGNNQNNWGGYWYTYDDLGSGGDSYVVPWSDARWAASGQQSQPFFMQSPGRTGSGYAARMTGYVTTTFQYGYVGMGSALLDPKGPVNLSSCGGIIFWYKGDGRPYRMKITSSHPNFVSGEGDNHYGYAFTSTTDWTQINIPMSNLTQEPYWGSSVNLSDALSMATDIQFQSVGQPHASIDLWIDEIDVYGCSSCPSAPTPTYTATTAPTPVCNCPSWFGKKVAGAYAYDFSGFFNACKYRLFENGTVNSIVVSFASTGGGEARVALYTDNGGTPGNLIVQSASEVISSAGWHEFDVPDVPLTAGTYWVAIQTQSGVLFNFDTIGVSNEYYNYMSYDVFPDVPPSGGGNGDGAYDIYINYCPLICPNPTQAVTPVVSCECPAVMGKQYDGGVTPGYITGFMAMNWYGMSENGIAQSISVRVESGTGNMRLALYDDVSGEPGRLLVESASTAVGPGWNEIDINDIALEAGKVYWIAMQSESSSVYLGRDTGASGDERYMAYPYKQFPEIALSMNSYSNNWDVRVNYCPLYCPGTPSPTFTDTFTPTDTWTPTETPTDTLTPTPTNTSGTTNPGLVDDMDDNNNQNNWGGYWYTYDDLGSSGDSYVVPWSAARWVASGQPTPEQMFFMQSPGRTGSGYAARMTGYVTTTFQWGFIGMGTSFLDPKAPVDLSSCTGVKFWQKGDGRTYRMKISSSHPNFLQGESDNHYGYAFVSNTNWTQMDILMTSLTQEPYWGTSVVRSDALSMATDIQFQTVNQPHTSIDLWIDEIEFYGCSSYPGQETPTWTFTDTPTWTETPVGPTYTYTPTQPTNPGLVDDMDDNNNQNNWGGYWYTYDDLGSSGDSYVVPWSEARWNASGLPKPVQLFYMQSPGRTGSGYAARMTGYVTTTFQYGFIGMGTSFLDPKAPVDLSSCAGVRFWYKGDGRTYRMKISSSHPNFLSGEADNHYGRQFTTTTSWQQADILLSSLTQEPYWGTSVNLSDALSMATDIQFQTVNQPHTSIDLWIDEIEFYGCSSYPGQGTPTNTNTPGGATNTWTNTPTRTNTPTWTATPLQGTGTPTPTPGYMLKFDDTKPLVAYPNPNFVATPIAVDFYLVKPADIVYFRLYTVSGRLIREIPFTKFSPNVSNHLIQGKNTITIDADVFNGLAQGTYYYVLVAQDETKRQVKSKIEKIIIFVK